MTALILTLLLSAPTEVEIHYMPAGTPLELKLDGKPVKVRYYLLEEYKLLLKLDADLWSATESLRIYKDLDLKYANVLEQKDEVIRTLQGDIQVKDERIKRVEGLWHDAEQRAIENAGGPIWPYIVGGVGAVVGIVGATLWVSELARH